jgi:hypothetical protein
VKHNEKGSPKDAILQEFNKLLSRLGLKRDRLSFYCLRHTFRTQSDEIADFSAIDRIMGHKDNTMGGRYREFLVNEEARLRQVTDHVRAWLFPQQPKEKPTGEPEKPRRKHKAGAPKEPRPIESLDARPVLRVVG